MDNLCLVAIIGLLTAAIIAVFAPNPMRMDAVEHGYGQWCPDRSFAWQHEECE